MNLWIRTKDKTELIRTDDIRLYPDIADNKVQILIRDSNNDIVSMGSYTKERAIEIIEDINAFKDALLMLQLADNKSMMICEFMKKQNTFTYTMPKE